MYSESEIASLNEKIDSIVFGKMSATEEQLRYISLYVSGLMPHQSVLKKMPMPEPKRVGVRLRCPWCNTCISKMNVPMAKGEVVYYRCMNPLCTCQVYATHRYEYVESKSPRRRISFTLSKLGWSKGTADAGEEYAEKTLPIIDSTNQAIHLLNEYILKSASLLGAADDKRWKILDDTAMVHEIIMSRNLRYWGTIIPHGEAEDFHSCYSKCLAEQRDFAVLLSKAAQQHDLNLIISMKEMTDQLPEHLHKCYDLLPDDTA
jgi:hypothetical protein